MAGVISRLMIKMKAYGRLLGKSLLVLLPLFLLCLYLKLFPLCYSDDEVPYYVWTKALSGQQFEVVILGDSTGNAAFLPNLLGENVVNLSLGGATPIENYYIFQNYMRKNAKPKVCYVAYNDAHLSECDCLYSRILYSHILTFRQEVELFSLARRFGEKAVLVDGWLHCWLSHRFYSPEVYLPAILASSFGDRLVKNRALYHYDDVHFGAYMARSRDECWNLEPYTKDSFGMADLFAFYYERLLRFCADEGIQVRLVKLPVNQPVTHTQQYLDEYRTFYAELLERFPSATLLWIQDGFDQHDFFDDEHLNVNGAIRFSRLLRERYPADFSDAAKSAKTLEGIEDYLSITYSADRIRDLQEAAGRQPSE